MTNQTEGAAQIIMLLQGVAAGTHKIVSLQELQDIANNLGGATSSFKTFEALTAVSAIAMEAPE